jgi:uncharacterized protein (DUF58 family)
LLALLVVSAGYALWNRTGLRLTLAVVRGRPAGDSTVEDLPEQVLRTAPQTALFEGDTLEMQLGLDTDRSVQGPAWISGEIVGAPATVGTGIIPKTGWRRDAVVDHLWRGPVGATGWTITTSDPLGFFIGRRQCSDTEIALVYPRFTTLSHRRPVRELETAAAAPRAGSGYELFGIREYRPGDSLRRIHWRSSARHGELVVREYEPPGVQTVRIVVDPAPPTRAIADQIARIAASEAWDCLREGGRAILAAPGLEPADSADLWELLTWLARYPNLPRDADDATPGTVVITAHPDLLDARALHNWLVGDAEVETEFGFERVGTKWPL